MAVFPASKSIHSLEQSSRPRASQRNKTPSGWSDPPADRHLSVQKPPDGGGIIPLTGLPASKKLQWVEEGTPREYEKSPFREPHEGHGRKTPTQPTGTKAFRAPRETRTKRRTRKGFPECHARKAPGEPGGKTKKGISGAEARREPRGEYEKDLPGIP